MNFDSYIPINSFGRSLHRLFFNKGKEVKGRYVRKTYPGTEDHFFEGINKKLQATLDRDSINKKNYQTDLERFGTRQRLIDVADDTVISKRKQELPPLKKPFERRTFKEKYRDDVKRFGTKQRLINVANDEKGKEQKSILPPDFSKNIFKKLQEKYHVHKVSKNSENPFAERYRELPKAQVTIHNTSNEEKEVLLWGGNQSIPINVPPFSDVQHQVIVTEIVVPEGVHPQAVVFNPANNYLYVANQLSGNVTVINSDNEVVTIIALQPELPGLCSPVALTVNTNPSSSKYGYVYVACSVANTLAVINLSLNVSTTKDTMVRPVAVAFNPVNNYLYITHLVSHSIMVIHAETFFAAENTPIILPGQAPFALGIHPINGDIYMTDYLSNDITVFDVSNNFITTLAEVGTFPVSVTYNPANGSMYALAMSSNSLFEIDSITRTVTTTIAVGNQPTNSFFNAANNFLYVQNSSDQTLTAIRPDNSIAGTVNAGEENYGTFNGFNNLIYISDTIRHIIRVIGYNTINSNITIDGDYSEMIADFQNSPAVIQHVRFVVTGTQRINSFRFSRFNSTGTIKSKPLSMELYASPQSVLNVAEVTGLSGTVIDGKMNWKFKLPALHTVSVLLWYRQFEVRDLLVDSHLVSSH